MKSDPIQTVAFPGERLHIPGGLRILRSPELVSPRLWPGGSAFSSWPPPRPGFRARRGLRAGPASSAPSRGPAGGSALLANGRRASAPSPAREEPPRSCATCGAWAPDPRPPPRPREARGGRVRKRGLGTGAWARARQHIPARGAQPRYSPCCWAPWPRCARGSSCADCKTENGRAGTKRLPPDLHALTHLRPP